MGSKISEIIDKLTLEEKASLCSGLNFWRTKDIETKSIPSITVSDGPHGLRKMEGESENLSLNASVPAICFPTAVGLAASWDQELAYNVGVALGQECQQEEISIILGPAVNIKRSPLCGRNFEYISEDPYITGEMAASLINGIQSQGIGTSLKHFAANNQEKNRMTIDAILDERAYREIYLSGFEKAVKVSKPWTLMCAYNKINSVFASENKYLLTDILRDEWGFDGVVMTDWGATNQRVDGLVAGVELEMPSSGGYNDQKIVEAVNMGILDRQVLDRAVERLLKLIFRSVDNKKPNTVYNKEEHHQLAREVAAETIVLLKNENSILPLNYNQKIAVIGEFAKNPRYQGAGSSLINTTKLDIPLKIGQELLDNNITYAQGYSIKTDKVDHKLIDDAVHVAREADIVIIMAGLTDEYESEGFDRTHMQLPTNHNALIEAITDVHKNVVVVLSNGSPVEIPWIDKVEGLIEAYLYGQGGGAAIWDILLGKVNPSAKLAETFPINESDCSVNKYFPMGPFQVEYRESIYVGYRYYDAAKKDVRYPFGYGLSYTEFEYYDMNISQDKIKDNETVDVSIKVKNIGKLAGKEVVQLYVKDNETTIFRPEKELKGFKKIHLEPGEEKMVIFSLEKRSFAYYNIERKDWQVESGSFEIMIGSSSRNIKDTKRIIVTALNAYDESKNDKRDLLPNYYNVTEDWKVEQNEYEALLGRSVNNNYSIKPYHMNSTIGDISHNFIGKRILKKIDKSMEDMFESGIDERQVRMIKAMLKEMPLRNLIMMSDEQVKGKQVEGLIHLMNFEVFKGIRKLLN